MDVCAYSGLMVMIDEPPFLTSCEMNVGRDRIGVLQGTLNMLILKVIALGPVHGYGILNRIRQLSREMLQVEQGSLYPALNRLEQRGWIKSNWGLSECNRRAKYFQLTSAGREQFKLELVKWEQLSNAIRCVLSEVPVSSLHVVSGDESYTDNTAAKRRSAGDETGAHRTFQH